MLHRHHPLLQAGEKNQDGGVLELFYVFPYFCIFLSGLIRIGTGLVTKYYQGGWKCLKLF